MEDQTTSAPGASTVAAGVDRAHSRSIAQKTVFLIIHAISLAVCACIAFPQLTGIPVNWFGHTWKLAGSTRAEIVFWVTALYEVRLGITLLYLLRRKFGWSEALGLGFAALLFEVWACLLAAGLTRTVAAPLGWLDFVAIAFVLIGSCLNTCSEIQRKLWKEQPENAGRCYTKGLFAWSRHINYFGDCVLFTGWCLLTTEPWMLAIPSLMALTFIFYHIPGLEQYLEGKYGDEFREYRRKTSTFIPFLY